MNLKLIYKVAIGAGCFALASYVVAGPGHGSNSQGNSGSGNQSSLGSGHGFNSQKDFGGGQTFNSQNNSNIQHGSFGQSTDHNASMQQAMHGNNQSGHQDNQVMSIDRGNRERMVIGTHVDRAAQLESAVSASSSTKGQADNVFSSKILETGLDTHSNSTANVGNKQETEHNFQSEIQTPARKSIGSGNNEGNENKKNGGSNADVEHQDADASADHNHNSGDQHQDGQENQNGATDNHAGDNHKQNSGGQHQDQDHQDEQGQQGEQGDQDQQGHQDDQDHQDQNGDVDPVPADS